MKRIAMFLAFFVLGLHLLIAQTVQITGTVTSKEDGQPLPGASVLVKGTQIGTTTDFNGKYSLNVPSDAQTLVISFVGMKQQEVAIAGQAVVDATLESEAVGLEEVVVTALGIKRSQKAIGYSATTVSNEKVTETRSSNIMSGLSGKIAGVQIAATSTDPGASNSVIIRGVSSLGGSNQPLYIVDDVPINNRSVRTGDPLNNGYDFGNGANMVNPDDIESITFLKGAAATALYGNRAASGVVIITTKSGKSGKGQVEINSGVQVANILRLPQFQNDFGMGWDGHHTLIENGSWGPRFDGRMHLWGNIYDNSQKMKPFTAQKDNIKDFFDQGVNFENSVSFSGGSDNTNYYASFSQVSDNGLVPGNVDIFDKYTASLRGGHTFGKLKLSTSLNYSEQKNKFAPTGQNLTIINALYQTPRDISIISLEDYKTDPFDTPDYYYTPYGVTNPYYLLDVVLNDFKQKKFFGKVQADLEITKHLNAVYRFGVDATDNQTKTAFPRITATPGTPNEGQVDKQGNVFNGMSRSYELTNFVSITYQNTFNKFDFSVIAGSELNQRTYNDVSASITGLDIPTFYDLSNSAAAPVVDEYTSKRRLVGIFSQAELGWDNFLFLTLTARNDWSSTLPKQNNSFFYPGSTLSFLFSEKLPESFKKILSLGKLRLAYGQTGSDAGVYMIAPSYVKGVVNNDFGNITFPLNGKNAFELGNSLGNSNLSPEKTTEMEAGLNLNFFNSRIALDFAYYDRKSEKQIYSLDMDPSTGYTSQTTNLGEISNKGIEFLVSVVPVKLKNFTWEASFNYTRNKSKVVSLPEELGGEITLYSVGTSNGTTALVARVGKPVGLFKVTTPEKSPDGKIVVNVADGRPVTSPSLSEIGESNFDYESGLNNTFRYKNVSLSFDFDFRHGGYMYSRTKDITYFTGNAIQTTYNDRRPFIIPNSVNKVVSGGSVTYVENTTPISTANMDDYYADGCDKLNYEFLIPRSYVKLRSVVISYNLPKAWVQKLKISNVKISAFGSNLFIWTPEDNTFIDPEVSSFGNDLLGRYGEYSANPTTRKFGLNLQIKF